MSNTGGLDFGAILAGRGARALIEPSQLYEALPNKAPNYGYLRLVQGQVLEQWHGRRAERDVVIKVNTGGGKTIDGLVMLQSLLNEGNGPALYVAPDPFLVKQVLEEAKKIGLATVTDPDDPRYLRSQAICVINAYKLVNGRSVFAGARSPRTPAPIGSVVIDDAHAAIATTRAQLSLTLPLAHPAFDALLNLFTPDLEAYSPHTYLDVAEQAFGAMARVPFWSWRTKINSVRRILRQHAQSDELKFSLPAIQDVLPLCRAVFSGKEVTITPPCPPIQHVTNFLSARHRIYLTATLADDGVLVTDFDADPRSIANPISPGTAGDIGERMILAPQEINPGITSDEIRLAMKTLSQQHNVVVLAPSNRVAQLWAPYADQIAGADDIESAILSLRDPTGPRRLVVLVNKYDGIDLPGNACRVLVLDGLPEAFSPEERLESQLTTRTSGTDDRQIQRIEQGMGRAVRSNEDHCVVVLIGHRLSQLIAHPDTVARLGPATQAQIRLSSEISRSLENLPLTRVLQVAQQALQRDPHWVQLAKDTISALPPRPGFVGPESIARRQAFNAARNGDLPAAEATLLAAAERAADLRTKGWLLEQRAMYLDQHDPDSAQTALGIARAANPDALRPLVVAPYAPIASPGGQGERAVSALSVFAGASDLALGFEAVIGDLTFDPARTEEFEEALGHLGKLIGLNTQRPEKDHGLGPDNLWALSATTYWVIEVKSGASTNFIAKKDVNQLAGSANWFQESYRHGESMTPVIVHQARTLGMGASAVPGMRIVNGRTLGELTSNARNFASAVAQSGWSDATVVEGLLHGHGLMADDLERYLLSHTV
jgi:hypothetical protein